MDWKKLFDSVGLNGTWWQWRIARWQERWDAARTRTQNAAYQHRLCRNCGGLMDRDTKICDRCGMPLENWRKVQVRRAAGMLIPAGFTVSYVLMATNVIAMGAMMMAFGWSNLFHPDGLSLVFSGALVPDLVMYGEVWRLISYAFLHGGLLHIFFNLFSLTQVGPITENEIGRSRFIVVYILAALGGAAADMAWHHYFGTRPLIVGASGAIFGLIGFGLTFNHFHGGQTGSANARVYLQWAIYSFVFGFLMTGVDNVCHAGGFVVGALLGFIIERDLRHGGRFEIVWRVLATLCVVAVVAALVFAVLGAAHFLKSEAMR